MLVGMLIVFDFLWEMMKIIDEIVWYVEWSVGIVVEVLWLVEESIDKIMYFGDVVNEIGKVIVVI